MYSSWMNDIAVYIRRIKHYNDSGTYFEYGSSE